MNAIGKFATGAGIVAGWFFAAALPAVAAELVMFERAGCVWCVRWHGEVGAVYERTPEGRMAPLRRVDVGAGRVDEPALATPVRYTPTFVLVDRGREVGRITGYSGDDAFWGLLGKMLADHRASVLSTRTATTTE
ncbi:MAG: hypothetical protein WBA66_03175 [Xanthobacteraceae bacterium]